MTVIKFKHEEQINVGTLHGIDKVKVQNQDEHEFFDLSQIIVLAIYTK